MAAKHHIEKDAGRQTGVYQIRNTVTERIYIGSASRGFKNRWTNHVNDLRKNRHGNRYLQRAWNKYGESAFEFTILLVCPPNDCVASEQSIIESKRATDRRFGYNIAPVAGSSRGIKRSAATRKKLSEFHKARWKNNDALREEFRQRRLGVSLVPKGTKRPPHVGEAVRLSNLRRWKDPERLDELRQRMLGNKHCLGHKHTEEARENMRLAWVRRKAKQLAKHQLTLF